MSMNNMELFEADVNIFSCWTDYYGWVFCHYYQPQTKEQLKRWKHPLSHTPKKAKVVVLLPLSSSIKTMFTYTPKKLPWQKSMTMDYNLLLTYPITISGPLGLPPLPKLSWSRIRQRRCLHWSHGGVVKGSSWRILFQRDIMNFNTARASVLFFRIIT